MTWANDNEHERFIRDREEHFRDPETLFLLRRLDEQRAMPPTLPRYSARGEWSGTAVVCVVLGIIATFFILAALRIAGVIPHP